MDETDGYVYLTTRVEREVDAVGKVLTHAKIPFRLKDLPRSVGPAFGAIGLVRQELLVPEAELMRARALIGEGEAPPPAHHHPAASLAIGLVLAAAVLTALYIYLF